jgi:hypothetical protein
MPYNGTQLWSKLIVGCVISHVKLKLRPPRPINPLPLPWKSDKEEERQLIGYQQRVMGTRWSGFFQKRSKSTANDQNYRLRHR